MMLWILIQIPKKAKISKAVESSLFQNPAAVMSSTRVGAILIHVGAILIRAAAMLPAAVADMA